MIEPRFFLLVGLVLGFIVGCIVGLYIKELMLKKLKQKFIKE